MMKKQKSELRKIYSERRMALSEQDIDFFSQKITEKIITHFHWEKIQNVHLFLPIKKKKEVNTQYLLDDLWQKGKRVFAPKVVGDFLECHEINPKTEFSENHWGILEPMGKSLKDKISFDLVVTPLLYCDKLGNRIGYGKGFYDKFFTEINPDTMKAGVNFFPPKEEIADVFAGDIPLDYLFTPEECFSFKSKSIK
ncbi:MAG: 5-formyltetrahydrofolate cyclo-ligase [Flavobacteriaceae bacterium]|nr:5-formyltetrahydrofolate cyclo-ligase [Flavobacteriaceae bacterium]